jgi:hypothetical protein
VTARVTNYTGALSVAGEDLMPYVTAITVGMDVDRVPFWWGRIALQDLPDAIWRKLEPRVAYPPVLSFVLTQYDTDTGLEVSRMPSSLAYGAYSGPGAMFVAEAERDILTGEVWVECVGWEHRMVDKGRVASTVVDHGHANVLALANSLVSSAIAAGITITDNMGASSALIAAGDRRLIQPGETNWDVLEAEASAAGGRMYADVSGIILAPTSDPPRLKPYTPPTISAHDPEAPGAALVRLREKVARAGDWADGVVCRYDWRDAAGVNKTEYWASTGASTKARTINFNRPRPAANQANAIVARSLLRGRTVTADCRADFRYRPGYDLVVATPTGTTNYGMVRAVEYTLTGDGEALMTLTAQTGQPL